MAKIKLTNENAVQMQIIEEFGKKAVPIIMQRAGEAVKPFIGELLVESFYNTEFYRALVENEGADSGIDTDFRAIFGLTTELAVAAGEGIANVLREIFDNADIAVLAVTRSGRQNKFGTYHALKLQIDAQALSAYLQSESFGSYTSGDAFTVPWLEWFLVGGDTPGYKLIYSSSGRFNNYSRSGNAIMVEADTGDYWEFNSEDQVFTESDNFMSDLLENTTFLSKVSKLLQKEITAETKAYEGIIK